MHTVASWLRQIRRLNGGASWQRAFIQEARNLRDFDPTIVVRGVEGQSFKASERWLVRETTVMQRFPIVYDPAGEMSIRVDANSWCELLAEGRRKPVYRREVVLPTGSTAQIDASGAIERYVDLGKSAMSRVSSRDRAVFNMALTMVKATGIIPYDTRSEPVASHANTGIL